MTFTLPELPYAYDALQPYMSRETLEFHHDKHHAAYVNTGNNLLKGSELEGKSVEEVVKASYGKNQPLFNNAGQHYNHIHFWQWIDRKSTRLNSSHANISYAVFCLTKKNSEVGAPHGGALLLRHRH